MFLPKEHLLPFTKYQYAHVSLPHDFLDESWAFVIVLDVDQLAVEDHHGQMEYT